MTDGRPNPGDLSPRKAVERYLRRRRADATEATVKAWKYRLKLFVEWIEGIGIERVEQIRPYDLDEYYELRSGAVAVTTLEGEMWTLKKFIEYLEQLDAIDDGLAEAVRIPDLDDSERSNDAVLEPDDALPLIQYYRNSESDRATRAHVFLELAWYTGARQGGIRALDLRDVRADENYLSINHRPDTGTPLKNKEDGERPIAVPPEVIEVLQEYIRDHRYDVHDDHGRQPLLSSANGRPTENTVRNWSYLATQPCLHSACPHGKERDTCKYTDFTHGSKCPSSRSPHRIRTGSITWQLDVGLPPEVVAERVNATLDVIEQHYDAASAREQMERRRRPYIDQLELDRDADTKATE
jgi:site-specific recombinase XerD